MFFQSVGIYILLSDFRRFLYIHISVKGYSVLLEIEPEKVVLGNKKSEYFLLYCYRKTAKGDDG